MTPHICHLGLLALGDPEPLREISGALFAFNVPLISVTERSKASSNSNSDGGAAVVSSGGVGPGGRDVEEELLGRYGNLLTTVPDRAGQIRALIEVAKMQNLHSISLISSNHDASKVFVAEATTAGLTVPRILELNPRDDGHLPNQVQMFLSHSRRRDPAIALLVTATEAAAIAEHLLHETSDVRPKWLLASLGLDAKVGTEWKRFFRGGVYVEPHMPELEDFKKYFVGSVENSAGHEFADLMTEYKEEAYSCTGRQNLHDSPFLLPCDEIPQGELEQRFRQDPYVSFVVKAVSALTAAFRLVQLERCGVSTDLLDCLRDADPGELHADVLGNLRKLSFSAMATATKNGRNSEGGSNQQHFARNGRLVANRQQVYLIDQIEGLKQIGSYVEGEGFKSTSPLSVSSFLSTTTTITTSTREPPTTIIPAAVNLPKTSSFLNLAEEDRSTFARAIADLFVSSTSSSGTSNNGTLDSPQIHMSYESFASRTWAVVVVSLAVFGSFATLCMLMYVLQKMCNGLLTGNQTMGIILLLGVLLLYCSVVPWVLPPGQMVCEARHVMHPLVAVLCFSILLVKAMQLRSISSLGINGSIPLLNQLVSLFFMVTVQVVIVVEWSMATKPLTVQMVSEYPTCGISDLRFFLLHLYPCVLCILALFYSVSVVTFKHNFNEGRLISFCLVFVIPVMVIFLVVHHFSSQSNRDMVVTIALLLLATIILSVVFVPKMVAIHQESRMARKRHQFFSSWPQWNGKTGQLTSPPQQQQQQYKWFGGGGGNRMPQQHNNYNIYSTSNSSYDNNSSGGGGGGGHYKPRRMNHHPEKASKSPKSSPPLPQHPKLQQLRPRFQGKRFNGMNYFTAASPVSYYYFGETDNHAAAAAAPSTAGGTLNTATTGRRMRKPEEKQQQQCKCCSHGNKVHNNNNNYLSAKSVAAAPKLMGVSSSSVPSLIEAQCYPGTVIITPDNLSYKDEGIWTHKYDTR